MEAATTCHVVSVTDLDLASPLETRIMCTRLLLRQLNFHQTMPTKNPCAFLNQPDAIASLMPQAQRLIELRKILAAVLPESLARHCSIANYKQGKVVIFAANSAVAAKLKLLSPGLSEELSRRAAEVTGLEVRVQPLNSLGQVLEKSSKLSIEAAAALGRLAQQLSDSELKTALDRIARRRRS
jgi:hypothetical protein